MSRLSSEPSITSTFEADADAHAIEERLGIGGFADGAGRHRAHAGHAVVVHHLRKPASARMAASIVRGADAAGRERVAAEEHRARGFLEHLRRFARAVLRDEQPDGGRAQVDNAEHGRLGGGPDAARCRR